MDSHCFEEALREGDLKWFGLFNHYKKKTKRVRLLGAGVLLLQAMKMEAVPGATLATITLRLKKQRIVNSAMNMSQNGQDFHHAKEQQQKRKNEINVSMRD